MATKEKMVRIILASLLVMSLTGCTLVFQKGRRSDIEKIDELNTELDQLAQTKKLLEQRLKQEIADKQVSLEMAERGLVITFVAEILFDSGKAKLREEAFPVLGKVARVINENVPEMDIGVEGHTDNEPIKYSGWKSNWELSSARAMSVLHYLVDEQAVAPTRVTGIGAGEFRPVEINMRYVVHP
ncbi:flagellar motor protein MotB [Candidatus Omnitrophota bacterium]